MGYYETALVAGCSPLMSAIASLLDNQHTQRGDQHQDW